MKISTNVSRNEASLVIAGGLCFGSSDMPLLCGASSSVDDARFRFVDGRVVSDSWVCSGAIDMPFATTSAADMVLVHQVGVNGLECLVGEAVVIRDGSGDSWWVIAPVCTVNGSQI